MTRREAREALFQLMYEMSFNSPDELDATLETAKENRNIEDEYITRSIHEIYSKLDEIDRLITENAQGWKSDRLSKISSAIMRISVYEMKYTDIPYTISINEAVEIAKKFDHENAPSFINGILNTIAEKENLKKKQ